MNTNPITRKSSMLMMGEFSGKFINSTANILGIPEFEISEVLETLCTRMLIEGLVNFFISRYASMHAEELEAQRITPEQLMDRLGLSPGRDFNLYFAEKFDEVAVSKFFETMEEEKVPTPTLKEVPLIDVEEAIASLKETVEKEGRNSPRGKIALRRLERMGVTYDSASV